MTTRPTPPHSGSVGDNGKPEREIYLENKLHAILLVYKNNDVAGIDCMAQIAIDALEGIPRFAELLSKFGKDMGK